MSKTKLKPVLDVYSFDELAKKFEISKAGVSSLVWEEKLLRPCIPVNQLKKGKMLHVSDSFGNIYPKLWKPTIKNIKDLSKLNGKRINKSVPKKILEAHLLDQGIEFKINCKITNANDDSDYEGKVIYIDNSLLEPNKISAATNEQRRPPKNPDVKSFEGQRRLFKYKPFVMVSPDIGEIPKFYDDEFRLENKLLVFDTLPFVDFEGRKLNVKCFIRPNPEQFFNYRIGEDVPYNPQYLFRRSDNYFIDGHEIERFHNERKHRDSSLIKIANLQRLLSLLVFYICKNENLMKNGEPNINKFKNMIQAWCIENELSTNGLPKIEDMLLKEWDELNR